jgi:23S rRNA-/tRNA-specific pseudouridylate synthase
LQVWARACGRKPPDLAAIQKFLHNAEVKQAQRQHAALKLAFQQKNAAGEAIRQDPSAFAPILNLPVSRCKRLLQAAIKATALPGDPEPVDIVFEDEHLIAVNKPAHLRTQPIHRHVGGSMVNRLITYLGYMPRVRTSTCESICAFAATWRALPRVATEHGDAGGHASHQKPSKSSQMP